LALERAPVLSKYYSKVFLEAFGDQGKNVDLRARLGIDDIITIVQRHRLRWYGHVLKKDKNDWVKMHVFIK